LSSFDITQDEIDSILQKYPTKRSAVLPLCLRVQKAHGFVSSEAIQEIAGILELDPTEVKGIVGFYTLLREKRAGRFVIQVCNDLPCSLRGADHFVEHVCKRLDIKVGETTSDGLFTVETVMCIAGCAHAPVAQIDLDYHEKLDPETFEILLDDLKSKALSAAEQSTATTEPRVQ
jgi:NADH-quinone oxidoreductase subunit E